MNRPVVALSVLALLAGGSAVACANHAAAPEGSASSTAATATTAAKSAGHTGDTLTMTRADGSTIAVTLLQVISPVTVAPGAASPADTGKTYLATKLKIADPGTVAIDGDVNINVSVVGSDNESYAADLSNVTECTNFESGAFHLNPGESATGCVVFALPHGVSPTKVKYLPSAGFADDFGEWTVS